LLELFAVEIDELAGSVPLLGVGGVEIEAHHAPDRQLQLATGSMSLGFLGRLGHHAHELFFGP
jgi:hypothetical protein